MGNSNAKRNNYHNHHKYDSQYSLSDLLGGSCVNTAAQASNEERRSWSRASNRSWTKGTVQDIHGSSKTVWPVPRFQLMFLPEFPVKEYPLKTGYSFLDVIAKGAYGKVCRVQKQETSQVFALKVISKAMIVAENSVQQAKEEAAILRMVGHHPFIVNSVHRWQGRKTLYILMNYVSGGELFSLVDEYGCLPEKVVRIYVAEIALAIVILIGRISIANVTILLQFPSTLSSELLPDQDNLNCANVPGILPANADISPAARDLLKRLLQPDPRLRLKTLLNLQRIAFYMGYDIQSYMLKKESPFRILGVKNRGEKQQKKDDFDKKFSNFESFPGDNTTQTSLR
ncbi:hypothetical protein P5V15_013576 [Pogonomyrmex californicus]